MASYLATMALVATLFTENVEGFWRMNCGIIQRGRIDPLVNFGAISSHSHSILGGSNIGISSTYESMLNSECTSCEIGADKSAYWSPDLFYQYSNGSFYAVPHDGGVVYYLGRGENVEQTIPFPPGLNILTGKMTARSYDTTTMTWGNVTYRSRPIADRVSFACLDSSGRYPETPGMDRTECNNGMRAQIHYQSCWNGIDLYKADNSHVAYMSQIDNGVCPPTHPKKLPHLFMERLYSVANVPNKEPGGRFVFSQGDTTGYGFHADFQNGWDPEVLAGAVKDCLYTEATRDGVISQCPILQANKVDSYRLTCPEQPPQIGEPVKGLLEKLPGCIKVTTGPEDATPASWQCPAGYVQPSVTPTADSTPRPTRTPSVGSSIGVSPFQKYLGCFDDSGKRVLNAARTSSSTEMSVNYCQSWCQAKGYRLSGVEYAQECYCDNVMLTDAKTSSECTYTCTGTKYSSGVEYVDICGGAGAINVYNNTDPAFGTVGSTTSSASLSRTSTGSATSSRTVTGSATSSRTPTGSTTSSRTPTSSAASSSAPSATFSPLPQDYVGCATDNKVSNRTLQGAGTTSKDGMTIELCKTFCGSKGAGYQYYGVEYGAECYCGNEISGGNIITDLTTTPTNATCNMRCSGAADQICGGPGAISLFKNATYVAPEVKASFGAYVSQGCLTDPGGSAGRALQGASTSGATITAGSCVKFCQGKKLQYAGLEYGGECYCGNSIVPATGAKATTCAPSDLMPCAGDPTQYCGGSKLMNLYYASSL